MSYGIESKKLKRLVDFYSPFNSGQQLKFLSLFKGQQGLLRYLQTSSFQGIDSTSVQQRKAWFGSNHPNCIKQPQTLTKILILPLSNFAMKLYMFFSILTLITEVVFNEQQLSHEWLGSIMNFIIFFIIYLAILIPQLCQHYQNTKIKKYMLQNRTVKVWRDNQKVQIQSFQLVVGDVVQIQKGDVIGADGILIQGNVTVKQPMSYKEVIADKYKTKYCLRKWNEFQDNNAVFIIPQDQTEQQMPSPILLAGSEVLSGQGKFVVLCVGKHSRIGYFMHEIHRAAVQRHSLLQKKLDSIIFQISKYLVLMMILFTILYTAKVITFAVVNQTISSQNWLKDIGYLLNGYTIVLMGMPIMQLIGLIFGSFYVRYCVYRQDNIWYKYVKDCGTMRDVTSIVFQQVQEVQKLKLIKWWNHTDQQIQSNTTHCHKTNQRFEQFFVKSLQCQNFSPYEAGLKIPAFFIGMNPRFILHLEGILQSYASERMLLKCKQSKHNDEKQYQSDINVDGIQDSEQSMHQNSSHQSKIFQNKEIQNIFIKGNSETLLKQCTHIMDKKTGKISQITYELRESMLQSIQKMNSLQQPSLITGFIQVHPNHPRFRQAGYKVVMLSLISYKQNHDNQQFQSLARMRKMGISVTLMSTRYHDQAVSLGKQMGVIMTDKPSIRLKGYDFTKVIGGIVCKFCKKSTCICTNQSKFLPTLKNQDEFNRIYKHLNVLSQANSLQKLALAVGFSSAQQKTCFFGNSKNDVPAMRQSTISCATRSQMQDQFTQAAAQIIVQDNSLLTIQKMVYWSYYYCNFVRKYFVFALTSCFVAFGANFISFLLFDTLCIQLIQFIWVTFGVGAILGVTFVISGFTSYDDIQISPRKQEEQVLNKTNHRQISSQVFIQILLIMIVLLFGPYFIPQDADDIDQIIGDNWEAKYFTASKQTICSGVKTSIFSNSSPVYLQTLSQYNLPSRHLTFIFNLFTLMQFLNYLNCRILYTTRSSSTNFFKNISISAIICVFVSLGLHVLVLIQGGDLFALYPKGLTVKQWALCGGLALAVVLVGLIVKQIPQDQDWHQDSNKKVWPNRSFNLAVMATMPRESLQDFEIDEELQVKKMALMNQ